MKARMQIRRISGEIDVNRLDFATLTKVGKAIATLEAIAETGSILFTVETINGPGKFRRHRPRKGDPRPKWERPLQPQPQRVLSHMIACDGTWQTVEQIAAAVDMKDNSVRPHLILLEKRGEIESTTGSATARGGHKKLWRKLTSEVTTP